VRPCSNQPRDGGDISIQTIASVWDIDEQEVPGPGLDAYELFRKIDCGAIRGHVQREGAWGTQQSGPPQV
jgi:hypothetical protein